jgi:hypothetical protein
MHRRWLALLIVAAVWQVAAVQTLYRAPKVFNMQMYISAADGVDASSCVGDNPKVCATPGTGTDYTTVFAKAVDVVAAEGGGRIHFPMSGTGKYRGFFLVDEDNIRVTCAPGVQLMPVADDTDGGMIMQVAQAGAYTEGFHIKSCEFYIDYPEYHGHNIYDIADVDNPIGVTGSIASMADYNAPSCAGTCGAGDDIAISGTFLAGANVTFEVEIVAESTPDTFRWRRNQGFWSATLNVSTSATAMANGISVAWADTDNHTAGDVWTIIETPTPQTLVGDVGHGLSGGETVELYSMTQANYDGLSLIGYIDADSFTIRRPYTATATGSWRQAPGVDEDVQFGPSLPTVAGTGEVTRYNEVSDEIRIYVTSGTLTNGDDIRISGGGGWTVENVANVEPNSNVAMSGLALDRTRAAKVEDCTFTDIGGYSVEIDSADHDYPALSTQILDNDFVNCPSLASKDACVDVRASDYANIADNDFSGGVSGGDTPQGIVGLATGGSATAAPRWTTFSNNRIYDNDTADPQGPIDIVDWGLFLQPNATDVDFEMTTISGGFIHLDHKYEHAGIPHAAIMVGASDATVELRVSGVDIKGRASLAKHVDNRFYFDDFTLSCMNGVGVTLIAAKAKFSDGEIRDCAHGGLSATSGDGDISLKDVDVLDTGVGITSGSTGGQVRMSSDAVNSFKMTGGRIAPAPSLTRNVSGIDCSKNENTHVVGVNIYGPEARGVINCHSVVGGQIENVGASAVHVQSGLDGAIVSGVRMVNPMTTGGAALVCVDFDGDNGIVQGTTCASDAAIAIDEGGNWNQVDGNVSTDVDGSATGGTFDCDGGNSACSDNLQKAP